MLRLLYVNVRSTWGNAHRTYAAFTFFFFFFRLKELEALRLKKKLLLEANKNILCARNIIKEIFKQIPFKAQPTRKTCDVCILEEC